MREYRIAKVSESNYEKDLIGQMRSSDNMSNLSSRDMYAQRSIVNDLMAKIDSFSDSGFMQPNFNNRVAKQFRFSGLE